MKGIYVMVTMLAVFDVTQGRDCTPYQWKCANERCVVTTYICDGNNNCGDWSDEGGEFGEGPCPECPSTGYFQCDNGRCVYDMYRCDGDNHCRDWSDETEKACPCLDGELRCSTHPNSTSPTPGKCVPPEWICDPEGVWDCPFGDDEQNCDRETGPSRK